MGNPSDKPVDPRSLTQTTEGLGRAWSIIEETWSSTFDRTILGSPHAYDRLGLPTDHRVGQPAADIDVSSWGIDVASEAPLAGVLEVRAERMQTVRQVVDGLAPDGLHRTCDANPAPGFPPMTALPFSFCLNLVVGEEWAHHEFATRDLTVLEGR